MGYLNYIKKLFWHKIIATKESNTKKKIIAFPPFEINNLCLKSFLYLIIGEKPKKNPILKNQMQRI